MDHVKETKTEAQQAPAATSASSPNSASCSSSSSASSTSHEQQHSDQDGSNDITLPQVHPLPAAAAHLTDNNNEQSTMESGAVGADGDSSQAMDIEQQPQQPEQQQEVGSGGELPPSSTTVVPSTVVDLPPASLDPARVTDELASSLSFASLTSSSNPVFEPAAAPPTATATATDSSASLAISSSSSNSASSSSSAPSDLAPSASLSPDEQRIQDCLKQMHCDIKKGEASVRAMLKMLHNLQKAPTKADNRRMRKDVSQPPNTHNDSTNGFALTVDGTPHGTDDALTCIAVLC